MRPDYTEYGLLIVGGLAPFILVAVSFFSRKRVYATWAKVTYILASLTGTAWALLGFMLWPPLPGTRNTHFLLLAIKQMCAGLAIGFMVSVLIARPYAKKNSKFDYASPPIADNK